MGEETNPFEWTRRKLLNLQKGKEDSHPYPIWILELAHCDVLFSQKLCEVNRNESKYYFDDRKFVLDFIEEINDIIK